MMNTEVNKTGTKDQETVAANTSVPVDNQVLPGAVAATSLVPGNNLVPGSLVVANDKDNNNNEVIPPEKQKVVLTLGETVPASGEVAKTMKITGEKQQDSEGTGNTNAFAKAKAD